MPCVVCLQPGGMATCPECAVTMHPACALRWFASKADCPVCRRQTLCSKLVRGGAVAIEALWHAADEFVKSKHPQMATEFFD